MLAPVIKLSINQKEVSKMLKVEFKGADVYDNGYGLEVNGKSLVDIISMALGTKVKGKDYGYGSGLPSFSSRNCDVLVVIDPHPTVTHIETEEDVWESVESMEEGTVAKYERIKAENAKADPEE